ncbi:hypothetical protein MAPG_01066 [Magnaporthiopsis poae ATCC 64411]|uniref:Uncharacterized protein n=1 Tax=Magnaporthiopsis poae (strain ATCC 64411 / 73-15) TaxID=644358 RepID=A0A0C4DMQ4_MAGP6|nr:hypothetical protein MAPG_01066 [Magnaporthiopsis poae ATCC 64411]
MGINTRPRHRARIRKGQGQAQARPDNNASGIRAGPGQTPGRFAPGAPGVLAQHGQRPQPRRGPGGVRRHGRHLALQHGRLPARPGRLPLRDQAPLLAAPAHLHRRLRRRRGGHEAGPRDRHLHHAAVSGPPPVRLLHVWQRRTSSTGMLTGCERMSYPCCRFRLL